MTDAEETKRQKARLMRYKKPIVKDLNYRPSVTGYTIYGRNAKASTGMLTRMMKHW